MTQKKLSQVSISIILCAICFFSCDLPLADKQFPATNQIKLHSKFRINLPEEHSSGYLWQLSENYDMTKITQLNSVWHGPKKGVDFNFETLAAGQTTLTFVLRKYNDTSDVQHFPVNITLE